MRLLISLRNETLRPQLRDVITRRVHFALGRFGHRIQRTELVLSDENGPRGGPDQRCTLRIHAPATTPIVVETTDVSPIAAVDRALARAARRVRDRMNRRRDLRRQPGPTAPQAGDE